MLKYIAVRLAQMVTIFLVFLTLIFFLLSAQPGSIANQYMAPNMTAEQRRAIVASIGADRPVYEQYLSYMQNLLRGDLGTSFSYYPRPVFDIIKERAPRTLVLFLSSTVVSFTLGFTLGKMLAWRRGKLMEYAATLGGVTLYTIFLPWFGLMMIWFFAFTLGLFPIGKFLDPVLWRDAPLGAEVVFPRILQTAMATVALLTGAYFVSRRLAPKLRQPVFLGSAAAVLVGAISLWASSPDARYALDILHHMVLPIVTLALVSFAGTMLLTRTSMMETLREDFVMAARAKGLPERVVRDRHAARNAMLPVVTSFVFSLAMALDGGVITETIFSWPGMGLTMVGAVTQKDIPLAVGGLMFGGILALTAHLVADVLYAYLDPRIRYA